MGVIMGRCKAKFEKLLFSMSMSIFRLFSAIQYLSVTQKLKAFLFTFKMFFDRKWLANERKYHKNEEISRNSCTSHINKWKLKQIGFSIYHQKVWLSCCSAFRMRRLRVMWFWHDENWLQLKYLWIFVKMCTFFWYFSISAVSFESELAPHHTISMKQPSTCFSLSVWS